MTWALLAVALVAGLLVTWYLTVKREADTSAPTRPAAYAGDAPGRDADPFGFTGDLPAGDLPAGDLPVGDVSAGAVEVGTGAYGWRSRVEDGFELDALAWDDGSAAAAEPLDDADEATWSVLGPPTETGAETRTEPRTEPMSQVAPTAQPEPEHETVAEPMTEPEPQLQAEPEPEAVAVPQPEPDDLPAPEPEPEPEAAAETEPEAETEPMAEPEAVTEAEPDGEPEAPEGADRDDAAEFGGQPTVPPDHYLPDVEGDSAATRWIPDAADEDALMTPRPPSREVEDEE